MKNKTLKQLFKDQFNFAGKPNNDFSILNPDYIESLYGGLQKLIECTTHSGDCSQLTSCGNYTGCSSKCTVNVTPAT